MLRNVRVMGNHVNFGGCCNIFGHNCKVNMGKVKVEMWSLELLLYER